MTNSRVSEVVGGNGGTIFKQELDKAYWPRACDQNHNLLEHGKIEIKRIIDYIEMYCVICDNRAMSVVILPVDVKSLATDQLEYYIVGR